MWMLFVVLLFPAGLVGYAVGHDTSPHAKTVTVTTGAAPATSPTTTAAAPAPTTTAVASPPSVAGGKAVFLSAGCAACHTFKAAGATGKVGPDLDTAPEKDAKATNMALAAFVKESIVSPDAYISPGFPKGVMPPNFASKLGAKKVDELVAFITAGTS
jgi:mono/diheme cytochrome c family protein